MIWKATIILTLIFLEVIYGGEYWRDNNDIRKYGNNGGRLLAVIFTNSIRLLSLIIKVNYLHYRIMISDISSYINIIRNFLLYY